MDAFTHAHPEIVKKIEAGVQSGKCICEWGVFNSKLNGDKERCRGLGNGYMRGHSIGAIFCKCKLRSCKFCTRQFCILCRWDCDNCTSTFCVNCGNNHKRFGGNMNFSCYCDVCVPKRLMNTEG